MPMPINYDRFAEPDDTAEEETGDEHDGRGRD